MAKRVRTGDIIEIATKRGLAYAQLTHVHERFGALLRVVRGIHKSRLQLLNDVSQRDTQFQTFFPLQAAVNRKIVTVVGNEPIPERWTVDGVPSVSVWNPGPRLENRQYVVPLGRVPGVANSKSDPCPAKNADPRNHRRHSSDRAYREWMDRGMR